MNVLIASNYNSPSSGNFIGSLIDLGIKMREEGNSVCYMFPKTANTLSGDSWTKWIENEGFSVYLVDISEKKESQLTYLKSVIEENNIEILHTHFDMFLGLALHSRKDLPVKILIHEHMEYPAGCNRIWTGFKYFIRSLLFRKNKLAIACVNKYVNSAYLGTKHWFIPNGLSFKRNTLNSIDMTRADWRNSLLIKENEKMVLFLGWDLHRKGLDIAVQAVDELRKSDKSVVLGIVGLGSGDSVNSEGMEFIEKNTGISAKSDWIRYLPSTEHMFSYHKAVDVYLSSSRSEAFSYGLLEAISQNTPIVVSDIKGTKWSSVYNKSLFYPVEDFRKCAEQIGKAILISNRDSNYKDVCEEYCISIWCEKVIKAYKEL